MFQVAAVLNHYTEEEQRSLLLQAAEACYWRIYADNNTSINSTGHIILTLIYIGK